MAPLAAIRARAGVEVVRQMNQKSWSIDLRSSSGHLVGQCRGRICWKFYRILSVRVSGHSLERGLGRLLQIEAAFFAIQNRAWWKIPPFSYTLQGQRAFLSYPLSAQKIMMQKIPLALVKQRPVIDLPWKAPSVSVGFPIGK